MKCKKCQIDLSDSSKYCPNCGTVILTKFSFIQGNFEGDDLIKMLIQKIDELNDRIDKLEKLMNQSLKISDDVEITTIPNQARFYINNISNIPVPEADVFTYTTSN